eukprot:jgi/Tetstr1/436028/TSEL_024907.t1
MSLTIVGRVTGISYPLKKTPRFPIAAPPFIERICYATFNYRAGYTTANHIYAKETVMAEFREYTPSPFLPAPLRPSLWVVMMVHLVMYKKQRNHSELGRYYQAGKCSPSNVMIKGEEEVCQLHGLVGVMAQHQKRAGGITKNNTNAVKNLARHASRPRRQCRQGQ